MTKTIISTNGTEYLVSDEDYDYLSQFTWFTNSQGYAYRRDKIIFMHREIMQTPDDLVVDHKNRVRQDNTRENLRNATRGQNGSNKYPGSTNKTGYKGVYFDKQTQSYRSQIRLPSGKRICLGRFQTAKEASDAYNKISKETWGDFHLE